MVSLLFKKNIIVNFHEVNDSIWFEKTICTLKRIYRIIDFDELHLYYHSDQKLNNTCHITFDDGHSSFYNIAYPILVKHNVPASIFVSPKIINEGGNFWFQEIKNYDLTILREILISLTEKGDSFYENISIYSIVKSLPIDYIYKAIKIYQRDTGVIQKENLNMTLDQLLEISNSGLIEIGGHTLTHPILKNETDERSFFEIEQSILELEASIGRKVRSFAYPNGRPEVDFSKREFDILKKLGIRIAFSTENRSFSNHNNPLSIPRTDLSYGSKLFVTLKLLLIPYIGPQWTKLRSKLTK